jgi:alginate O-acetyltransferase complex protein AlgI
MLFTSYPFILIFFPAVISGFFFLARFSKQWASLWLTAASLVFYGWWDYRFVALLVASIAFNYSIAFAVTSCRSGGRSAKALLLCGVAGDLLLLIYFKYTNFMGSSFSRVLGIEWHALDIVLPLGISFFTFTQIAFLVDSYRGIASERNFAHYCLFVSYFPHLIAGPVLHHKQMMPQFDQPEMYRVQWMRVAAGAMFFTIGLAKKVLVADSFANYANPVFDGAHAAAYPGFIVAWVGTLAYALQLYFDFSGYSDMAVGLSLCFGVQLPLNFNSPYKATNIIEFWRRWHISLSQFLRDYLYIALGGNRYGVPRRYVNLFATMLLGGLWHGANWTFVIWGALHGLYLMIDHGWRALCLRLRLNLQGGWYRAFAAQLTFLGVVVAWVFFRAEDVATALRILSGLLDIEGLVRLMQRGPAAAPVFAGYLLPPCSTASLAAQFGLGLTLVWLFPNSQQIVGRLQPRALASQQFVVGALLVVILLLATINASRTSSDFIYFNF